MSSNGPARLAETCETRDESPSLDLGRGWQGDATRAAGTDLRVARLRSESEATVDLMTVPHILDYESGWMMKRATDQGTGSFPVSVVCESVVFFRKRVLDQNEQRACYLCVEQRSMASRDGGTHPRDCAEVLVSQQWAQ